MAEHSEQPDQHAEAHVEQSDSPAFNRDTWLLERRSNPNYIMVEIGHGPVPVAFNQEFKGKRAYIGIEAWLRYRPATGVLLNYAFKADHPDENIFLIDHPNATHDTYSAETILPEEAADEVFLSNVMGDPQVALRGRAPQLLNEAARLLTEEGKLVIRETMTPHHTEADLTAATLAELGWEISDRIEPKDAEAWEEMEVLYAPGRHRNKDRIDESLSQADFNKQFGTGRPGENNNFYLILSKIPQHEAEIEPAETVQS